MIGVPPVVQLLLKISTLGAAADYAAAGIVEPVKVRHRRNRGVTKAERPIFTIVFVSDEPQGDGEGINPWETQRELVVDLQFDARLPEEDSGEDPTGLGVLLTGLAVFVDALKSPDPAQPVWLDGLCDWINVDALEPEDRSTPDEGRMTRAIRVLYRVRADDANVLLAAGVNG